MYTMPVSQLDSCSRGPAITTDIASTKVLAPVLHIWVVLGPAGSGKSSVCQKLAALAGGTYIEGDDYHPPANVAKMSSGRPLTDQDRRDWLWRLNRACMDEAHLRTPCTRPDLSASCDIFLSCSALRHQYRDFLRLMNCDTPQISVHFIYLHVPFELACTRVAARKGHYMGTQMVQSQYETLEEPADDEADVIRLDASKSMEEVVLEALHQIKGLL